VEQMDSLNIQDHKYFLRYIQQRMDFLAQLSTEFSSWSSSHWFAKEIMKFFYEQHHLLDFIAQSENLQGFHVRNGRPYPDGATLKTIVLRKSKEAEGAREAKPLVIPEENGEVGDLKNDVLVSIPGGLVGFHAIYTILENFIRNAAKHGYATLPKPHDIKPEIYIKLGDSDRDLNFYPVVIWDNFSHISHPGDYQKILEVDRKDCKWLENNDLTLAHYNEIWPGDLEGKELNFCFKIFDNRNGNEALKNFFDKIKNKMPDSLQHMIQYLKNLSDQGIPLDLSNDFKENLVERVIFFVNRFIRADDRDLQSADWSVLDDHEFQYLSRKANTSFQRSRFKRLVLEKATEGCLKNALPICVEHTEEKPEYWRAKIFEYWHVNSPYNNRESNVRRFAFRIGNCPAKPDPAWSANTFKSMRFVDELSWQDLCKAASNGDKEGAFSELSRDQQEAKLESFLDRYYAPVHWKINRSILKSLIDEEGKLRLQNWGIAEMKICAGYLKGAELTQVGAEDADICGILKAMA